MRIIRRSGHIIRSEVSEVILKGLLSHLISETLMAPQIKEEWRQIDWHMIINNEFEPIGFSGEFDCLNQSAKLNIDERPSKYRLNGVFKNDQISRGGVKVLSYQPPFLEWDSSSVMSSKNISETVKHVF